MYQTKPIMYAYKIEKGSSLSSWDKEESIVVAQDIAAASRLAGSKYSNILRITLIGKVDAIQQEVEVDSTVTVSWPDNDKIWVYDSPYPSTSSGG